MTFDTYTPLPMQSTSPAIRTTEVFATPQSGQFYTAASAIRGGITTPDISTAGASRTTAETLSWGWGGGIEPPTNAPVGDSIGVLLVLALGYGLWKWVRRGPSLPPASSDRP